MKHLLCQSCLSHHQLQLSGEVLPSCKGAERVIGHSALLHFSTCMSSQRKWEGNAPFKEPSWLPREQIGCCTLRLTQSRWNKRGYREKAESFTPKPASIPLPSYESETSLGEVFNECRGVGIDHSGLTPSRDEYGAWQDVLHCYKQQCNPLRMCYVSGNRQLHS